MNFTWDENKNRINFEKHGIRFEEASELFRCPYLTFTDNRLDYGEVREISIGRISPDLRIVIVYTKRDEIIRIISARKANARERKQYDDYIKETTQ